MQPAGLQFALGGAQPLITGTARLRGLLHWRCRAAEFLADARPYCDYRAVFREYSRLPKRWAIAWPKPSVSQICGALPRPWTRPRRAMLAVRTDVRIAFDVTIEPGVEPDGAFLN